MNIRKKLKSILNSVAEQASCRVFVANKSINRKVLIVADEPSIRNLLTFVRKLDSRWLAGSYGRVNLSTISRNSFDTAILDLRCLHPQAAGRGYQFGEVWPSMVGRVLVINAEVNNLKTFSLVEKYISHRHTLQDLVFFLKDHARAMIDRSPSPHRV